MKLVIGLILFCVNAALFGEAFHYVVHDFNLNTLSFALLTFIVMCFTIVFTDTEIRELKG